MPHATSIHTETAVEDERCAYLWQADWQAQA
jgi:hypothetical protein